MAKRIDITDKLNFEERPVIIVKGKELEVNNDASNALKLMTKIDNAKEVSPAVLAEMADMLFTKSGKRNLDVLKLNMQDYSVVIETAMNMIMGEDEEGELENLSTI